MSFARRTHPIKKKYWEDNFFKNDVKETITELENTPKDIKKKATKFNFRLDMLIAFSLCGFIIFSLFSMFENLVEDRFTEKSARYEDYFLTYFEHLQVLAAIQKTITNAKSLDLNQKVVNHLLKTNDEMSQTPLKEQRTYAAFEDKIKISYSSLDSKTCNLFIKSISENTQITQPLISVNKSSLTNSKKLVNEDENRCSDNSNSLELHFSNIE